MRQLALICVFVVASFGASVPTKSSFDSKNTYAVFNAQDVLTITAANGYVSVIEFAENERVINIAAGFSEGWEIIDRENLLFIKPKAVTTKFVHNPDPMQNGAEKEMLIDPIPQTWKTNLIVTTNINFYTFDLVLNSKNKIYKMSFTYPKVEDEAIEKAKKRLERAIEIDRLQKSLNRTSVPRNWDYYMRVNGGSDNIAPDFAYDDGVFTYIGFDNTKVFPSAFAYDGEEQIVNQHIKKEGKFSILVIHSIHKKILLRSGDKLVGVFNKGYALNPLPKAPETSNEAEVKRELLNGK
ncbi:P-type conjugative transfer protein VirB9 [Helicobacter sp. CLO-3]|uniref:TrbG/VirB9 family P-type conjugative transfer protein n=1 Tax=unclassified Helicobacter TaxID=2593540 RepID=UPI00080575FD|nr:MULTISPECIES: TrbG/VirB9 family P-type conjugative transfer protein [unclassified Helicobacter]OBV30143.1 P-type conjugative transfer protein VirB9 [Helicobacter sp. CLO-3]OHU83513.1 P-type conjugative transfer protein VirB9 [Helicobacter sp. CLO-3]